MTKKVVTSRLMYLGGLAELLVGVAHFFMPHEIMKQETFATLPIPYANFVVHATIAVGLCITVFGGLSLYFSKRMLSGNRTAWVFGLSQGVLWSGRVLSEIILPVNIPLLFFSNPTVVVLPFVVVMMLIFLVPAVAFRTELMAKE